MDKEKKTKLEWFLNFMNFDVDQMSAGEKSKIGIEAILISHGYNPKEKIDPSMIFGDKTVMGEVLEMNQDEWGNLKSLKNHLKDFFGSMMGNIGMARTWKTLEEAPSFPVIAQIDTTITLGALITFDKGDLEQKNKGSFFRLRPEALERTPIRVGVLRSSNNEESLLSEFLRSLDGVPLGALRQCPECTTWFLHTSKRKRDFCSNRCAARKASRERRERLRNEKPEAYEDDLKKGAERARKSYVKKVKEKHPHAKVGRRPRKI